MRLLVSLVCLFFSSSLSAQSTPVDPEFGTDGRVTFGDFSPLALAVQPSGHVLAVGLGTESAALRRFHPDGRPDLTFGASGVATSPSDDIVFFDVVAAPGDVVFAVGKRFDFDQDTSVPVVARYDARGLLDDSFGASGVYEFGIASESLGGAAAVTTDGRIRLAESQINEPVLETIGFLASGVEDTAYGFDGAAAAFGQAFVAIDVAAATADAAGRLYVAGSVGEFQDQQIAVARLTPDGTLDATFGASGVVLTGTGATYSVAKTVDVTDRGVVVTGYDGFGIDTEAVGALALRYTLDGELDATFGTGGIVSVRGPEGNAFGSGASVAADGSVLIAGARGLLYDEASQAAVLRLTAEGDVDTAFGTAGWLAVSSEAGAMAADAVASGERTLVAVASPNGAGSIVALRGASPVTVEQGARGAGLSLALRGPNPSHGAARLTLRLGTAADVHVAAYDLLGREVAVLASGPLASGEHAVEASLPGSGTYVVRAVTEGSVATARVTVVR